MFQSFWNREKKSTNRGVEYEMLLVTITLPVICMRSCTIPVTLSIEKLQKRVFDVSKLTCLDMIWLKFEVEIKESIWFTRKVVQILILPE